MALTIDQISNQIITNVLSSKTLTNGDVVTLNLTSSISNGGVYTYFEVLRNGVGVFNTSARDISNSASYAVAIFNDIV